MSQSQARSFGRILSQRLRAAGLAGGPGGGFPGGSGGGSSGGGPELGRALGASGGMILLIAGGYAVSASLYNGAHIILASRFCLNSVHSRWWSPSDQIYSA